MDILRIKIKATTLIETIISFVVLGIIIGTTATLFIQVNRSTQLPIRIELHYKLVEIFNDFKYKNLTQDELNYKSFKIICTTVNDSKSGLKLISIKGLDKSSKTIDEIKCYVFNNELVENANVVE